MNGDAKYPKEQWLSRLAGGLFVTAMRAGAFVVRLVRRPGWDKKKKAAKSVCVEKDKNGKAQM